MPIPGGYVETFTTFRPRTSQSLGSGVIEPTGQRRQEGAHRPALLYRFMPGSEAFVNGFLICTLVGAGFGYAQYCFMSEQARI